MPLSRSQYDTIMKEYDEKRRNNQYILEKRYEEICHTIPHFKELDEEIAKNSIAHGKALLTGADPSILENLKQLNLECSMKKIEALVEYGYPMDYLNPIYDCPLCKDSGYIESQKCPCLVQTIIRHLYAQSGITNRLANENFSTFSYDYYSNKQEGDRPSPLENMKSIVKVCKDVIQNFPNRQDNFLFQGNTGVGKTFLSNCIAKELLDRGFSVIYLTSFQFFDILEKHRFKKKQEDTENAPHLDIEFQYLLECDLLILDDLGTEMNNSFISSQLFLCLNERLLKKKSTIISTNLSLDQLTHSYSERVVSRFVEQYHICNIYGDDIRRIKAFS